MPLRYGLLVVLLAACGSDSTSSYGSGANPPAGVPAVNVSMTDNNGLEPYAFSPTTQEVKLGMSVRWTNTGKASHTATSDETPAIWNSGPVEPAGSTTCPPSEPYCTPGTTAPGTYVWTPSATGVYTYHCAVHKLQGMTGTITVTSP